MPGIMDSKAKECFLMNNFPLGIGQVHAMHELFKADPRLAIIVLALLIALAFYLNNRR